MTTPASGSLEASAELKFGQVGIANLRLKRLDAQTLADELAAKVQAAPQLFARAPVVLDLSHLAALPEAATVRDLLDRIAASGMMPVGLSYGTSENEALARALGLPLFAKFRAAYERTGHDPASHERGDEPRTTPAPPSRDTPPPPAAAPPRAAATLHHEQPIRSGQQLYARGGDLVLTRLVGNGAEVIADGSIHVYGALRGRALAGAQGDTRARIYCREFHAELVSIAGHYRVFEEIPADLRGKPVQVWLDGEKLLLATL